MWLWLAAVSALVFLQGVTGEDCPFTVSVLDVPGVQCVTATPCSGTYYASGLSQGVGACPTGSSCALLPLTPIMGCAAAGRTDLVYVNADGTLTKDGKSVTLLGAPSSTPDPAVVSPSSTTTDSRSKSTSSTTDSRSKSTSSTTDSSTTDSFKSTSSSTDSRSKSTSSSTDSGSNARPGPGSTMKSSDDEADADNKTHSNKSSNSTSSNKSTSSSLPSESESTSSLGNGSAKQQAEFDPGSILSDGPTSSKSSSSDGLGLGLGSIIAIVVGCLAVVAIAAGVRLLKKGKEADLATPEAAGGLDDYNNGGGGGITPKENVLLL